MCPTRYGEKVAEVEQLEAYTQNNSTDQNTNLTGGFFV